MKNLLLLFFVLMSFAANAQLTVDCKTTTAISGTDTNYVHTDLIYQMLDESASEDSISVFGISGFSPGILKSKKILSGTVAALDCYVEYTPTDATAGYRYLTHAENIRAVITEGDYVTLKLMRPYTDIAITEEAADIKTALDAWKAIDHN